MKSNQNLKTYTKAEPKPVFINSELLPYYEQTDLPLMWVYECAKSLKPLKGIDVNDMQIEWWYKEFIRMGWKKKDFDRQFEAIKRATLYNRIDLESWLNTKVMYNEIDLRVEVNRQIGDRILKGQRLKEIIKNGIRLSDEDKRSIDLAESESVKRNYMNGVYDARQTYAEERRKIWEEKFKVAK